MSVGKLKSIGGLAGNDNGGGLTQKWWFAPIEDFLLLKPLKAVGTPGDAVTVDGDHTFTSPKGFYPMYATMNESMVKMAIAGERDNETYKVEFEAYIPGNDPATAEVMRTVKNMDCIVLCQHNTGEVEQLGNELLQVRLNASYDSGKQGSGKKGWIVKGDCFQQSKQFYPGVITINAE